MPPITTETTLICTEYKKGYCQVTICRAFLLMLPFFFSYPLLAQRTKTDSLQGKLTAKRACINVSMYRINLKIDIERQVIAGSNEILFSTVFPFTTLQLDLFQNLEIDSMVMLGQKLPYTRQGNAVFVSMNQLFTDKTGSVRVYYHGKPVLAALPPWDGGFTFSTDSSGAPWVGLSCEQEGASLWLPCKDHPSDEPDSVLASFEVPTGLTCVSNGNLTATQVLPDRYTRFTWKVSYPINLYNITVNIGNYAHFSDTYQGAEKLQFDLDYYVLKKNLEKAKKHFKQVKPMLACFEKLFGPYPFPKDGYALVETPYWGMEHQGAVAYGNNYKNLPQGFDFIIIHESGHEYWGNSISAPDAAEHWIHEGFCTYAETLFLECFKDKKTALNYLLKQRREIKNNKPLLGQPDVNFHDWPDNDIYFKGAWLLHTIRSAIHNDSLFLKTMKGLSTHYARSIVPTDSVIAWFNNGTGLALTPIFNQYLHYPNLPVFEYGIQNDSVWYTWKADEENFNLPLKAKTGNNGHVWLKPEAGVWKKLALHSPKGSQASFNPDTTEFLITAKKVFPPEKK
jgi:aminopeptidase N